MEGSIETTTILIVKNRCQFCYAFFKDREKIAEHSIQCKFRFSETFEAFDGKVKFACAVCFDVFQTRAEHMRHERLHKFPGGFLCSSCDTKFLNEVECHQHQENVHEVFSSDQRREKTEIVCDDCGALFEQESYLRLHVETDCGRHRSWSCIQCNLLTEDAYRGHMLFQHGLQFGEEDIPVISKYEASSSADENVIPAEMVKTEISVDGNINASYLDPLLLIVKEETALESDADRIVCEDYPIDDREFLAEENSTENVPNSSVRREPSEASFSTDSQNKLEPQNEAYHEESDKTRKINVLKRKHPSDEENPLKCNYCEKRFAAPQTLYRHNLLHGPDGSLVHKCQCCFIYFASIEERDMHMHATHKDKLTCEICNITFRNIQTRRSHTFRNHSQSDYRTFNRDDADSLNADDTNGMNSIEGTNRHTMMDIEGTDDEMEESIPKKCENQSTPEIKFTCPYCGRLFKTERGLSMHIIEHGPDGSLIHKCEYCTIHFKSIREQDEHQMDVHKEKLTCKICNRLFRRYNTILEHMRDHTRSGPKFQMECAKCGITFRTKTVFDGHVQSDCGRSPGIKCIECGKCYTNERSLKNHMKSHTDTRNFSCKFCKEKFPYRLKLTRHMMDRHPLEKSIECRKCDESFADKKSLDIHALSDCGISPINDRDVDNLTTEPATKANSSEWTNRQSIGSDNIGNDNTDNSLPKTGKNLPKLKEKLTCPHCSRVYTTEIGLKNHIIEHGPDHSLVKKCKFCPTHFKSVAERNNHQMTVHKEKLTCKICNQSFRTYNSMIRHVRRHTTSGTKQFVCAKCGLSFASKMSLEGHELSDCGRSPSFECAECGKFLTNKASLTRHMMIHTDERNFPCKFCDKRFRDINHLRTHTRYRHTQERPHKCPYCEKCFVNASSMKTHTIVHTGIKRYVCYGCGERYPTNSALHKHRNARKDTCALVPIKPPLEKEDIN